MNLTVESSRWGSARLLITEHTPPCIRLMDFCWTRAKFWQQSLLFCPSLSVMGINKINVFGCIMAKDKNETGSFRERGRAQFVAVSFSTTSQCLISSCHSVRPKPLHQYKKKKVTRKIRRRDPVQPAWQQPSLFLLSLSPFSACVYAYY